VPRVPFWIDAAIMPLIVLVPMLPTVGIKTAYIHAQKRDTPPNAKPVEI